ncbi:MAG: GNAT family N-acetyltransferase [Actinomycetota bacterium]
MAAAFSLLATQLPEPLKLADGTFVLARPISASDLPRLCRFYQRLSEETVYRRFMVSAPRFPSSALETLVNVDHHDREAIVATRNAEIIAVARYHRADSNSGEAEIAVVVEDRFQRRGVGQALYERLTTLAFNRGITELNGTMLADNNAATKLLRRFAPSSHRSIVKGELMFRIPLEEASIV